MSKNFSLLLFVVSVSFIFQATHASDYEDGPWCKVTVNGLKGCEQVLQNGKWVEQCTKDPRNYAVSPDQPSFTGAFSLEYGNL